MDRFDFEGISDIESSAKSNKATTKKRCWREIEAIKDKMRLQRELQDIDLSMGSEESFNY